MWWRETLSRLSATKSGERLERMSDTILRECIECGEETDCIEGICQECTLKQQPKATSIGNKIREIASKDILGQTKLVRDKDILNQAADRLDAWWKYINELKEEVDLLKQQPKAGDFTKDFREQIGRQAVGIGSLGEIRRMATEACDRLDGAEAENKKLREQIINFEATIKAGGECCDKLQERIDIIRLNLLALVQGNRR